MPLRQQDRSDPPREEPRTPVSRSALALEIVLFARKLPPVPMRVVRLPPPERESAPAKIRRPSPTASPSDWERLLAREGLAPLDAFLGRDGQTHATKRLSRRGNGGETDAITRTALAKERERRVAVFQARASELDGDCFLACDLYASGCSIEHIAALLDISFRRSRSYVREVFYEARSEDETLTLPRLREILEEADPVLVRRLAVEWALPVLNCEGDGALERLRDDPEVRDYLDHDASHQESGR